MFNTSKHSSLRRVHRMTFGARRDMEVLVYTMLTRLRKRCSFVFSPYFEQKIKRHPNHTLRAASDSSWQLTPDLACRLSPDLIIKALFAAVWLTW